MSSDGLFVAGLVSLAIHGGLFIAAGLRPTGSDLSVGPATRSPPGLQIRLLSRPDAQPSSANEGRSDLAAVAALTALVQELSADDASQAVIDATGPTPGVNHPQASLPRDPTKPIYPADAYLLRSALSVAPVPLTEVPLAWPAGMIPVGRMVGNFWLYIDESGKVDRFVSDGADLPPQLEEISRSAFLASRFEPGQLDGRAVKSLIRIEVEFDNRPSTAPAPSVVSEQLL